LARAWKTPHGVGRGGLLLDTLAYNFLNSPTDFDTKSFLYYDWLSRDFFKYLSERPEQTEYAAPGSRQRVKVKEKFQKKAKKAHKLCVEAIEAEKQKNVNDKWKKVYGRPFPASATAAQEAVAKSFAQSWDDTEEFIEDEFPVDIRESMQLDCEVKQNGFREFFLREMLARRIPLMTKKSLRFEITGISAAKPYDIYWKVLNRGDAARKRNCIRGQIIKDDGLMQRTESTSFLGDHIVECYCVKDGVVVAKNRIHVPINVEQNIDD
ncbi:MAG: nucleotide-binding domain-containing protein, partial [Bacteroidota bacterium]